MEAILQGFQLFQAGGPVMYLLLACSLFVGYIGIERAIFYGDMDAGKAFAEQFYTQMKLRRYDQAQRLAMDGRGGLPLILQDVFQHQAGPDVKAFVEMQSGIFVAKLRRRLYYLSVIVTMAPLLGLLGTISGMIRSFQHPQCPVRPGRGHYRRRRRSAHRHGFRPLRRHPGPGRPFLFHPAPGPHHYGYGNVFFRIGNDACESGAVTMRLRNIRDFEQPSIMIIPMIDIMFFLLVFFMMTSLSMVDLHSLGAQVQPSAQYVVTLKADGSLWLNGQPVKADELLASARDQQRQDSAFSVVLCADRGLDYGQVADVLDAFKRAGIAHIGLAADKGGQP